MLQNLSRRQWRAVASVYHLYTSLHAQNDDEVPAEDPVEEEEMVRWATSVLPALKRAFPESFLGDVAILAREGTESKRCNSVLRGKRSRTAMPEVRTARWRQVLPPEIDAFLSELLLRETEALLTSNERVLLRLLNKEQRRLNNCYQRYAYLKKVVCKTGRSLLEAVEDSGDCSDDVNDNDDNITGRCSAGGTVDHNHLNKKLSRRLAAAANDKINGCNHIGGQASLHVGVSSLASSVLDHEREEEEAELRLLNVSSNSLVLEKGAAKMQFICAGCGEEGGELFCCAQCNGFRHEACGGPKYGSPIRFCKDCCRDLGLDSSTTSLCSSTSTEERRDLGDDDDDTSLSGFIVRSSEEEDEGDDSSDCEDEKGKETVGDGVASDVGAKESLSRRRKRRAEEDEDEEEERECDNGKSDKGIRRCGGGGSGSKDRSRGNGGRHRGRRTGVRAAMEGNSAPNPALPDPVGPVTHKFVAPSSSGRRKVPPCVKRFRRR
ncbi:hypothetical protein ERJ75_000248100 [Trypanosoma vivax]|uniref:Uncharacterized protein n=1 Tax=Trypanosoma vivax (strain Y486) TaxID=1055687 RepID=G0U1V0_TRYVY|nr:hypothetical protein TRVL_04968 [Trypanosoma vivax]KAH8618778.1 hypothetical protein ERJ75_000248100 [Trypanosoma vivax]CCC50249.1 conserved hypothetical protein [Trypanosoma vivax Y486]